MANGLMVESAPKMRIIKIRFWLGWDMVFGGCEAMKIGMETQDS
jgi:hypothetical protein